jgi:hypothetical protein
MLLARPFRAESQSPPLSLSFLFGAPPLLTLPKLVTCKSMVVRTGLSAHLSLSPLVQLAMHILVLVILLEREKHFSTAINIFHKINILFLLLRARVLTQV